MTQSVLYCVILQKRRTLYTVYCAVYNEQIYIYNLGEQYCITTSAY